MIRLVAASALLLFGSAVAQAQPFDGPGGPPPPPPDWDRPPPPPPGWGWRRPHPDWRVSYRRCWWEEDEYGTHRVCRRRW